MRIICNFCGAAKEDHPGRLFVEGGSPGARTVVICACCVYEAQGLIDEKLGPIELLRLASKSAS